MHILQDRCPLFLLLVLLVPGILLDLEHLLHHLLLCGRWSVLEVREALEVQVVRRLALADRFLLSLLCLPFHPTVQGIRLHLEPQVVLSVPLLLCLHGCLANLVYLEGLQYPVDPVVQVGLCVQASH